MENCVICLAGSEPCIYLDSNEWQKKNIKPIIKKHLWWWYLKQPSSKNSSYICQQCWMMLSSFHIFYSQVEKSHQQYDEEKWSFLKGPIKKGNYKFIEPNNYLAKKKDAIIIANKNEKMVHLSCSEIDDESNNCTVDDDETQEVKIYKRKRKHSYDDVKFLAQCSFQFSCDLCNIALNNFTDLKYHYRISHDVSGHAVCCNKKFYNRGQFADHLKVHDNPDYFKCNICDRVLCNRSSHERHLNSHKQPIKSYIKCVNCMKTFSVKSNYERHILAYCKGSKRKSKPNNIYSNKPNIISKDIETNNLPSSESFDSTPNACLVDKSSDCTENDRVPVNNEPLIIRRQNIETIDHNPVVKFESVPCFKYNDEILSVNYADSQLFEVSNTGHSNNTNMSEHTETIEFCSIVKSESVINSVNGEIYNYTFIDDSNNENRICEPAAVNKRQKKSVKTKSTKKDSTAHENPNYFECKICGRVLKQRTIYEKHLKSHKTQSNKSYCIICFKRFVDENLLTRHQIKMHGNELHKEQICPFCSKVSPNMKTHRQHVRYNHTVGLKHACHICEKRFQYPSKLNEHISTHTGIPLHACPYCSRPFNSQANMHKHRKKVHPKEWQESRTKRLAGQKLRKLSLSKTV